MGVPGLWKELAPAARRDSLLQYTTRNGIGGQDGPRAVQLGCDASIWIEQVQKPFRRNHASAGPIPELRTLFFRLAGLTQLAVSVVFVFDGPQRPSVKRGKKVVQNVHWLIAEFKRLIKTFGFKVFNAAGEAEAELARLNQAGIIHAILTEDVDAFVFGAETVIRVLDFRKDIVDVYQATAIEEHNNIQLTGAGMLLIAMVRGGDYSTGLKGFGIKLAVGLARYGLGDELLRISYEPSGSRRPALDKWRVRLVETVRTDPKGLIGRRNPKLARSIPSTFPDMHIYRLYRTPAISDRDTIRSLRELPLVPRLPNFCLLSKLCRRLFWWKTHRQLGQKMVNLVLPGLVVRTAIMAADFQAPTVKKSPITAITAFRAKTLPGGGPSYRLEYDTAPYLDIIARYVDDPHSIPRSNTIGHIWVSDVVALYVHRNLVRAYEDTHNRRPVKRNGPSRPVSISTKPAFAKQDVFDSDFFESSDEDERASDQRPLHRCTDIRDAAIAASSDVIVIFSDEEDRKHVKRKRGSGDQACPAKGSHIGGSGSLPKSVQLSDSDDEHNAGKRQRRNDYSDSDIVVLD